ncbi:MAG: hypothetical protein WA803_16745, partial [Steroidobacteraceae bacterium]
MTEPTNRARYATPPALAVLSMLTLSVAACGVFGPSREPPSSPSPAHYAVAASPERLPSADGVAQQLAIGAH